MAFCAHRGSQVSTPFCTVCGTKTTIAQPIEGTLPQSAIDGEPVTSSAQETKVVGEPAMLSDGFFRTPFQVLVLSYATFGIYGIYWLMRGRRLAQRRLGEPVTSYWWYLFWLIPIVTLVSGIICASKIGDRVRVAGVPTPPVPLGLQAFFFFFVSAMWRLPDPYWIISILAAVLIATMHSSLATAERIDDPGRTWPKFSVWEWIITVVGLAIITLDLMGLFVDTTDSTQKWYLAGVVGAVLLSLPIAWLGSRRLAPVAVL
jgi:hypothetical protein